MPAVMILQVDGYTGLDSVKVNGVYMVFIALTSYEWKMYKVVCTKTKFSLTLAFAITVHKYQGLTLRRVVLSFHCKNISIRQNYFVLSCVRSINHVAFESGFSNNCFFFQSSIDVIDKIADVSNKDS